MARHQFSTAAARARKAAGLSQIAAAPMLCVTDRMLCHYEGDQTLVPADVAVRMADAYAEPGLRTLYCQTVCPIGKCGPQINPEMGVADSLLEAFLYDTELVEQAMRSIHAITKDGRITSQEVSDYEESREAIRERDIQFRQLLLSTERAFAHSER